MESYSLSRSHMYFLSSRYAVIIFLLLQHLELPAFLRRVPMDCSKDILPQFLQEEHFMRWVAIYIG